MKRENSVDIVRGIVMIIMALDHVRDLMHVDSINLNPTDLTTTTPAVFFTRWITHLCAPIFVFLAGTSVYLSLQRKNNAAETRSHLIKRGFWLIFLEFTVVNFGLFFDIGFHTLLFEVIATIGYGFIILGLLLKMNSKHLGLIGLLIIFCHNLTPLIPFSEGFVLKMVLTPFFNPTAIPLFAGKVFVMGYPPIPWFGIMLVGFSFGRYFQLSKKDRNQLFIQLGLGSLVLFSVVRFVNIYGDPAIWSTQKEALFTFMSFMNVTKYPPSLLFCLVTLGIMFLLLASAERFNPKIQNSTMVYGRVPLFYFIVHFYVIHIITLIVLFLQGFDWHQFEFASGTFGRPKGLESGLPLWAIYIFWILIVTILYKPCQWFGSYKMQSQNWWIRYL